MPKLNRLNDVTLVQTQGQAVAELQEAISTSNMSPHKTVQAAHYGQRKPKKKRKKTKK